MVKSPRKMKNFLLRLLSAGTMSWFISKILYPPERKLQEIKYLSKLTPHLMEYYNELH